MGKDIGHGPGHEIYFMSCHFHSKGVFFFYNHVVFDLFLGDGYDLTPNKDDLLGKPWQISICAFF